MIVLPDVIKNAVSIAALTHVADTSLSIMLGVLRPGTEYMLLGPGYASVRAILGQKCGAVALLRGDLILALLNNPSHARPFN